MRFIAITLLMGLTLFSQAQFSTVFKPSSFAASAAEREKRVKAAMPVIEKIYKDYATQNHFPGYSFGIVLDGKLIYSGSSGFADIAQNIPATSKSMFRIASMSKSFTSLALLKLRDEGRLDLDDPVEKYIPEMKGQALTKDAPVMTIRHLITHSAGFPEDNPWGDRQLADTEEEMLTMIKKGISFSNAPGLHYEYSNMGFAMQGYIIHKVSGMPYSEYIEKNILRPLGMATTTYEYTKIADKDLAKGYRFINGNWRVEALLHDGIYGAMGGMITSVEEFSRYMAFHLNAWPERNDPEAFSIARSTLREMHQPSRFIALNSAMKLVDGKRKITTTSYNCGLNWMMDNEGKWSVGHSGGLPGFGSNWRIVPEYGLGIVLCANVTYAPTSAINMVVLDTLVKLAGLQPREISVSPILEKRKKELVSILPDWKPGVLKSIFAENFFEDYPIAALQDEAARLFFESGKILEVGPMMPENQLRGSCILRGEKKNLKLSFTLTPENPALVQEYHLIPVD